MRVVAGQNRAKSGAQYSNQDELERHVCALSHVAERAAQNVLDGPPCTLVLRSAKSAPAKALTQIKAPLVAAGVSVKAILTKIEPEQELHSLLATLAALAPNGALDAHVRWARNPRLADAHEQAAYGEELCWTGDAVRRDADRRNRLVLFESAPDAFLRAAHAFRALWEACDPLPAHLLDIPAADGLASMDAHGNCAPVRAAARPAEGWPLLRH
ncbi:MAG: hypothetical protein AAGF48_03565 [Pseudomonadota bacterium]